MTVLIDKRTDVTLAAYVRVTRDGEAVRLGSDAQARIAAGYARRRRLAADEPSVRRDRLSDHAGPVAVAGGWPLPASLRRGIVLARLTDLVDGGVGVSTLVAGRVIELLDGGELPNVRGDSMSGAGESLVLHHLLRSVLASELEDHERRALLGGSPVSAASAAQAVLAADPSQNLVLQLFALSVHALAAPTEAYDPVFEQLWDDPWEAQALSALRAQLSDASPDGRRWHQAPVSWRILPRLIGCYLRALAELRTAAATALGAVGADELAVGRREDERLIRTAGGTGPMVAAALSALSAAAADLVRLADRHITVLHRSGLSGLPEGLRGPQGEPGTTALAYVTRGLAERARDCVRRALLPAGQGGGHGYEDVGSVAVLAYRSTVETGACLDAALAALGVVCMRALAVAGRVAPLRLQGVTQIIEREALSAGDGVRGGPSPDLDLDILAESLRDAGGSIL